MCNFYHAGWPATIGLAWHCSISCFTCPPCCFSVCFNGDHEASTGKDLCVHWCWFLYFHLILFSFCYEAKIWLQWLKYGSFRWELIILIIWTITDCNICFCNLNASFGRLMIQLKRTHFLYSSFFPSWLVTSPCLFLQDYQFTGWFLIYKFTWFIFFMRVVH